MDELEFVSTPLTKRLFSVTFFSIFEKLTCSITSTLSEPVRLLAEFSQPTVRVIIHRINIEQVLFILESKPKPLVFPMNGIII